MDCKGFPKQLEVLLKDMLCHSVLTSWSVYGELETTKIILRLNHGRQEEVQTKYRRTTPSRLNRDLKRAVDKTSVSASQTESPQALLSTTTQTDSGLEDIQQSHINMRVEDKSSPTKPDDNGPTVTLLSSSVNQSLPSPIHNHLPSNSSSHMDRQTKLLHVTRWMPVNKE